MLYIVRFFLLQTFTFAISVPGIPYVFFLEKREDLQKKFDVHDSKESPRPEKNVACSLFMYIQYGHTHAQESLPPVFVYYRLIDKSIKSSE